MNTIQIPSLEEIITPISPESPCGEDMSFSAEFDAIKEARRADDPTLEQGEWETAIKNADWNLAASVAIDLLRKKTKDLRVASWLTEALAEVHGLRGLSCGFQLIREVSSRYWENLYPLPDGDDQEQRIGNVAWLLGTSIQLLRKFPIVTAGGKQYSLADQEAAHALQTAIEKGQADRDPGKVTLQIIRETQQKTARKFYQQLLADMETCRINLNEMAALFDDKLGMEGPSFSPLKDALEAYVSTIERIAKENGILTPEPEESPKEGDDLPFESFSATDNGAPTGSSGILRTRAQAIQQLRNVAEFFRRTEPHSPVAYLADKAANWGEMPLHVWLRTVVKDNSALDRFEDLLGFDETEGNS